MKYHSILKTIMVQKLLVDFIFLGIIGGLLGIFYRNCLKPEGMIFNFIYYKWLKPWAEFFDDAVDEGYFVKSKYRSFLAWIAMPLGYCIYCSTFWITIILCAIYLSVWELPSWQYIVIGIITASGVQHIVVASACKWLINKHPDLDEHNI